MMRSSTIISSLNGSVDLDLNFQDYGFDYSDGDEANESGSADVENLYYTAKCE